MEKVESKSRKLIQKDITIIFLFYLQIDES